MRKAALHNLGCKVNSYETEAMQQLLEEAGYEIVPFEEEADVYVVNTCSVTNIADRKSRQMLHRAKKQNPKAAVVAVGCYVQAAGEELKKDAAVDLVIGNNKKTELVPLLEDLFSGTDRGGQAAILEIGEVNEYEKLRINRIADRTRAFIKVQDGCNQFCSYCIIPYTRGRVRSRDPLDVMDEVRRLADAGYQELVLTGIHLSSYGADFTKRDCDMGLLNLIRQVHEVDGIRRIRLGSLEPRVITQPFVRELAGLEKLCPHFHLSLQSGCDATLKRMNRRYTTNEYARCCDRLRTAFDRPAITTDVIVGFPGESEDEFEETRRFVETVGFYELHVFRYSRRAGTRAADMPNQVPEEVKAGRSAALLDLDRQKSLQYRKSFLGRESEVLLEELFLWNGQRYMAGHTKEYVKAAAPFEAGGKGSFVHGIMTEMMNEETVFLQPQLVK